jgi:hypothetical protein
VGGQKKIQTDNSIILLLSPKEGKKAEKEKSKSNCEVHYDCHP